MSAIASPPPAIRTATSARTRPRSWVGVNPRRATGEDNPPHRLRSTPGTSTSDGRRLLDLEREDRELRRANSILRTASAFFAAELDRPCR